MLREEEGKTKRIHTVAKFHAHYVPHLSFKSKFEGPGPGPMGPTAPWPNGPMALAQRLHGPMATAVVRPGGSAAAALRAPTRQRNGGRLMPAGLNPPAAATFADHQDGATPAAAAAARLGSIRQ